MYLNNVPDVAAEASDRTNVKRELVHLSATVELPQLHCVLHIVHVAGDQLVPCYTCSPLQNIFTFFDQICPVGLCRLFQVDGYQPVVLRILVGVEDSFCPLVGHVVIVGIEVGDDLGQSELALDSLLASGLLLQVGEVEQVVLAVLGGEEKEVPETSLS